MDQMYSDESPIHPSKIYNEEGEKRLIPCSFNQYGWTINSIYRLRVVHINSPSDFWIVINAEEFDLFQHYLHKFYTKYGHSYKVSPSHLLKNRYCVVYKDGRYSRALIINHPIVFEGVVMLEVFLFDFGCSVLVKLCDLYLLTEKMYEIPRFATRATITGK